AGEAGGRFAQQPGGATCLPAGEQRHRLLEPGLAGGDPAGQFFDRRLQLDRPSAQWWQRLVEADQRAVEVLQGRRQTVDRGREAGRLVGERPGEGVEVDDQALEVLLV